MYRTQNGQMAIMDNVNRNASSDVNQKLVYIHSMQPFECNP